MVGYSTYGFHKRHFLGALDGIAAAGFDAIELAADAHLTVKPTAALAADMRKQIDARGLTTTTIHVPMGRHTLGAPTAAWRQEVVPIIAEFVRFAGDLGAAGAVIHPVPNPRFLAEGDLAGQVAAMTDAAERSVRELIPVAAAAQVRLLLENLPYKVDAPLEYPLLTMRQLRPFIEPFPAEQVGLVFDTGHAGTLRLDPAKEIEAAGNRLWSTHLQDVDAVNPNDDHWVPTHGGLDWSAIRAALQRIDYQGDWTFEVVCPRHDETPDTLAELTRTVARSWGM